jgi:hypothetical protein
MKAKSIILCLVFTSSAFAITGVGLYQKNCRDCHGPAYKAAYMRESKQWEDLFATNWAGLKEIHKANAKAMKTLESDTFKRESKQVLDILKNNASDTGAVRSCDGINCG